MSNKVRMDTPFPVNREDYDRSIGLLENALGRAKAGDRGNRQSVEKACCDYSGHGEQVLHVLICTGLYGFGIMIQC